LIEINISDHNILVDGHAGYAPPGEDDIICAAISVLIQSFIISIEELTNDEISYQIQSGHINIKHGDLSEAGKLLKRSFSIAAKMIEKSYSSQYTHVSGADGR